MLSDAARSADARPRSWLTVEAAAARGALSVGSAFVCSSTLGGGTSRVIGRHALGFVLWFALGMTLAIRSVALDRQANRPRR